MSDTGKQLTSTVKADGTLELSLVDVPIPTPADDEVIIRVEAAPINPSDLGLVLGMADVASIAQGGTADAPTVTANIPPMFMPMHALRLDTPVPCGNEGAGVVCGAGSSDAAQALMGKTVAILGGQTYQQYRAIKATECLVLNEGTTPAEGAACFVNPLTAIGMVETMRMEDHTALVHTAAASNLGQMLVKICVEEDVPLVNIVRKQEQIDLLKSIGATHVVNMSADSFKDDLVAALADTGATVAFDATGGGTLASDILAGMEAAANLKGGDGSIYGSMTHKQCYIYGGLERSTTTLSRNFGMAWGLGGWLLTYFLIKIGPEETQKLKQRVADNVHTTFKSTYTKEISLAEVMMADNVKAFGKMATGEKFLINPNKDL
ncbi:MAG: NADH oxidase [Alphaproteobacteria bacterium]|nr:MAG: NADH oxidase [Alphaproteobacteria bacterium]